MTWIHGLTILANDIVGIFANGGGAGNNTFTYPSGFNAVPGLSNINIDSGFNTLGIAVKVAGGSEPSSYSVSSSSFDALSLRGFVLRGRNTSSPYTNVATTASTSVGTFPLSVSMTGLTAASGDDVVLLLGATGNASGAGEVQTLTGPTGFTDQGAGSGQNAFSAPVAYADHLNVGAGGTGTLTATWSSTQTGSPLAYGGYVISFAKSGGGGGGSNSNQGLLSLGVALSPLAWIIDRRMRVGREFVQDKKSRLFLPSWKKVK